MDRLLSHTHLLDSYLFGVVGLSIGLTLLWYGSSWLSVGSLLVMLAGLVAVVGAAAPPRLSLRMPGSPAYPDGDMQAPDARSYQ